MRNRRTKLFAIPAVAVAVAALAGCSQEVRQGWMPAEPGLTNHVDRIMGLWTTSWIVLLVLGVLVWGLMLFAGIAFRRRRGATGLPRQLRYNMPIEIFFTVVPILMILGFFAFTARDQAIIEEPIENPDVEITVYAKRWAWDFVYHRDGEEPVHYMSLQAMSQPDGTRAIDESTIPTLYLPMNSSVAIQLESRDVAHSFWIVDFLYKKDTLPGVTNYMYFETGDFAHVSPGKCAELCGEYHSNMLFNVAIVSQEEYDAYLDSLEQAGNVGDLGHEFNPLQPEWTNDQHSEIGGTQP